jgi:XTP/dITP diphosphohydrolase
MAHQLLLATRNKGKIEEFRRILEAIAPGEIELIGLDTFPDLHDVVEDGKTFQENALKKAREMCEATGIAAIADDSGLCIDFLNGDPGIFSARWAGSHGDDAANIAKVLQQLDGIPENQRGAHFTCVAALYLPDGRSHCEEAQFRGSILLSPIGDQGFGYDPIFKPAGYAISSAQMSAEEKDSISHRGKSLRAIAPHVITLLNSLG